MTGASPVPTSAPPAMAGVTPAAARKRPRATVKGLSDELGIERTKCARLEEELAAYKKQVEENIERVVEAKTYNAKVNAPTQCAMPTCPVEYSDMGVCESCGHAICWMCLAQIDGVGDLTASPTDELRHNSYRRDRPSNGCPMCRHGSEEPTARAWYSEATSPPDDADPDSRRVFRCPNHAHGCPVQFAFNLRRNEDLASRDVWETPADLDRKVADIEDELKDHVAVCLFHPLAPGCSILHRDFMHRDWKDLDRATADPGLVLLADRMKKFRDAAIDYKDRLWITTDALKDRNNQIDHYRSVIAELRVRVDYLENTPPAPPNP